MLNKIITSSLLVAASAVIANAALVTPSFNPTLSGTSAGSWTSTSGTINYYTPTTALYWSSQEGISNLITKTGGDTDAQTATLSTWVKFDDLATAGNLFTAATRNSADISNHYGYQLQVATNGNLKVFKQGAPTGVLGTINASEWTMVTLVVKKSTTARTATASLYLNGTLASSGGTFGTNLNNNSLGRLTLNTATSGVSLADFKVYQGTALTDTDVSALYAATKAIPEPSMFGLLAGLGALALVGSRRRRK